ncbi:inositol monophosphatase family protein [Rhodopila globiformis]|uniref:Inositol-1-monophosphatase n=1 Tax=Rhodopila globiformis TaxID=1071 RepID=A0A2S6NPB5_RHOGL|nr:inositol monophosphatase family protein [Rhodopila globiformis]PPQ40814.1 inositol monophosphatase [Rhodopila globiformis]
MSGALDSRLDVARRLAEQAAATAMAMRPPPGSPHARMKGPQDWVTEADGAVERFLSEQLTAAFPADGFQGEEGGIARGGSLRWVVDPIDGTSNFARGGTRFCVSVACLEGDTPLVGVIVAPAVRETISARRGQGAFLNGRPIRAAETRETGQAIMELGWSRRLPNADYLAVAERVLAGGSSLRQGGSGALGLADVAMGRVDGYAELHLHLWDVAAALVIVREAGARVSDFMANDGAAEGNAILACAPGLADAWAALPGLPRPL